METNKEYQRRELLNFLNQKHRYFDNVKGFAENLDNMDIFEQIEWIENGTYGAGACLALQSTLNRLTQRMNKTAHVGSIVLHALWGKPFTYWQKLPLNIQKRFTKAVEKWLKKKHNFGMTIEI